ncbi:DUF6010 family protein [Qipengyuania flava]|uniref:DUF6010 family protein n=1 Tax=Qipengyuania flava TaxID=192812 RepID=UPI001CD493D8|nr:DUF6010 family protein [Qipengyuania flava]MCA0891802.1 DUF6010 family protein [Qipengyuania flava]
MLNHFFEGAGPIEIVAPVVVALILIALISLLKEPARQKFSAVFVAGAGAAYLSGGFGIWEFAFCALITFLAFRGLDSYRAIAIAWLLHTVWDFFHHLYGNPIIPFASTSSFGCAICDPVLALWYAFGAPSAWRLFKRARPEMSTAGAASDPHSNRRSVEGGRG